MEEKKEEKKQENVIQKVKEESEKVIKKILDQGIRSDNVDYLYKLVDIHKDIANEEYWEEKEESLEMMYGNYGNYGEYGESGSYNGGRRRDSRGRYMEGGSYGRRGVPGSGRGRYRGGQGSGNYRGEELMDEMMFHYGNYSESGQYGAEGETMESLSNLMESAYEYFKELKENAKSPDEIKMMEHYFKKMGQM